MSEIPASPLSHSMIELEVASALRNPLRTKEHGPYLLEISRDQDTLRPAGVRGEPELTTSLELVVQLTVNPITSIGYIA